MKKLIVICIIATMCVGCGGSSSVDKAISQVEKSIDKLQKNKSKTTAADLQALEKEMEEPLKILSDAIENDKVGTVNKMKIIAITAKWATLVMEVGLDEMKKAGFDQENIGDELEKIVDEMKQALPEEEDSASESNP